MLLGARLTPHEVERQGITRGHGRHARSRRARAGRRLKLVARARREGRRVTARVALEELAGGRPAGAGSKASRTRIILDTDLLGEIAIVQRGGGLTQTAYALLSDLVTIARGVTASPPVRDRVGERAGRRSL